MNIIIGFNININYISNRAPRYYSDRCLLSDLALTLPLILLLLPRRDVVIYGSVRRITHTAERKKIMRWGKLLSAMLLILW